VLCADENQSSLYFSKVDKQGGLLPPAKLIPTAQIMQVSTKSQKSSEFYIKIWVYFFDHSSKNKRDKFHTFHFAALTPNDAAEWVHAIQLIVNVTKKTQHLGDTPEDSSFVPPQPSPSQPAASIQSAANKKNQAPVRHQATDCGGAETGTVARAAAEIPLSAPLKPQKPEYYCSTHYNPQPSILTDDLEAHISQIRYKQDPHSDGKQANKPERAQTHKKGVPPPVPRRNPTSVPPPVKPRKKTVTVPPPVRPRRRVRSGLAKADSPPIKGTPPPVKPRKTMPTAPPPIERRIVGKAVPPAKPRRTTSNKNLVAPNKVSVPPPVKPRANKHSSGMTQVVQGTKPRPGVARPETTVGHRKPPVIPARPSFVESWMIAYHDGRPYWYNRLGETRWDEPFSVVQEDEVL